MSYADNADTALRLLRDKGTLLTFKRFTQAGFDPVSGGSDYSASETAQGYAVILPVTAADGKRLSDRLLEALTEGRVRKLLVAAKGMTFDLAPNLYTEFEGSYWMVAATTPLRPDGATTILFNAFVERTNLSSSQVNAIEVAPFEQATSELHEAVHETLPATLV